MVKDSNYLKSISEAKGHLLQVAVYESLITYIKPQLISNYGVHHDQNGQRQFNSEIQYKSATQGTMIVAQLLGSKQKTLIINIHNKQ